MLFDDVPGGAGHVQRLEDEEELMKVLEAAQARVSQCGGCDPSASCYRCLRSYRNQFCHDLLVREPVVAYLGSLCPALSRLPDEDRPIHSRTGLAPCGPPSATPRGPTSSPTP